MNAAHRNKSSKFTSMAVQEMISMSPRVGSSARVWVQSTPGSHPGGSWAPRTASTRFICQSRASVVMYTSSFWEPPSTPYAS